MTHLATINWWGLTPAVDLQRTVKEAKVLAGIPHDNANELRILLVGPVDSRHVLNTLAHRKRFPEQKIKIFILDTHIELYARQMLFLILTLEPKERLGLQDKAEVFLELHGNVLVRDHTMAYTENIADDMIKFVTDLDYLKKKLPFIDISALKFKDRDFLEGIFKLWKRRAYNSCDMGHFWDFRVRKHLGTRYDAIPNVFDWDYSMRLCDLGAGIIRNRDYCNWRQTGIAYQFRDGNYVSSNLTVMSAVIGTRNSTTTIYRGYWGEIETGPYIAFGINCEDMTFFKKSNNAFIKSAHDIAEFNVKGLFYELATGSIYESVDSAPAEPTPATLTEVTEESEEQSASNNNNVDPPKASLSNPSEQGDLSETGEEVHNDIVEVPAVEHGQDAHQLSGDSKGTGGGAVGRLSPTPAHQGKSQEAMEYGAVAATAKSYDNMDYEQAEIQGDGSKVIGTDLIGSDGAGEALATGSTSDKDLSWDVPKTASFNSITSYSDPIEPSDIISEVHLGEDLSVEDDVNGAYGIQFAGVGTSGSGDLATPISSLTTVPTDNGPTDRPDVDQGCASKQVKNLKADAVKESAKKSKSIGDEVAKVVTQTDNKKAMAKSDAYVGVQTAHDFKMPTTENTANDPTGSVVEKKASHTTDIIIPSDDEKSVITDPTGKVVENKVSDRTDIMTPSDNEKTATIDSDEMSYRKDLGKSVSDGALTDNMDIINITREGFIASSDMTDDKADSFSILSDIEMAIRSETDINDYGFENTNYRTIDINGMIGDVSGNTMEMSQVVISMEDVNITYGTDSDIDSISVNDGNETDDESTFDKVDGEEVVAEIANEMPKVEVGTEEMGKSSVGKIESIGIDVSTNDGGNTAVDLVGDIGITEASEIGITEVTGEEMGKSFVEIEAMGIDFPTNDGNDAVDLANDIGITEASEVGITQATGEEMGKSFLEIEAMGIDFPTNDGSDAVDLASDIGITEAREIGIIEASGEEMGKSFVEIEATGKDVTTNDGGDVAVDLVSEFGITEASEIGITEAREIGITEASEIGITEAREIGITEVTSEEMGKSSVGKIEGMGKDVPTNNGGDTVDLASDTGITEASEIAEASEIGITEACEIGITEASEIGITETNEIGITEANEIGITESSEIGITEAREIGITEASEIGITEASEIGSTEASEIGITEANEIGFTEASEIGITEANEIGFTETNEIGSTEASEIGITEANEIGSIEATDIRITESGEIGITEATGEMSTTDVTVEKVNDDLIGGMANEDTNTVEDREQVHVAPVATGSTIYGAGEEINATASSSTDNAVTEDENDIPSEHTEEICADPLTLPYNPIPVDNFTVTYLPLVRLPNIADKSAYHQYFDAIYLGQSMADQFDLKTTEILKDEAVIIRENPRFNLSLKDDKLLELKKAAIRQMQDTGCKLIEDFNHVTDDYAQFVFKRAESSMRGDGQVGH